MSVLNRFYKAAIDVLVPHLGLIDKMVGDEVVGFFIPVIGANYRAAAVSAAMDLQRSVGVGTPEGAWLPLGIGVHAGPAFVGKVGSGGIYDFTAVGDTVNTCARLQSEAKAGEVVVSEEAFRAVAEQHPDAECRTLNVRGRDEPVAARILRVGG